MGGTEWTTDEQRAFLYEQLEVYLPAKENKATDLPQSVLDPSSTTPGFSRWPARKKLGLGPDPLSSADAARLGVDIAKTKAQLKTWLRYRDRKQGRADGNVGSASLSRSLFRLLTTPASTRPFRPVEIFQKMFGALIKDEVMSRGYGALNEEAELQRQRVLALAHPSPIVVLTEEETQLAAIAAEEVAEARVRKYRSLRMSLWRNTAIEMFEKASEETKALVKAKMEQLNAERAKRTQDNADDDGERTPEEYQKSVQSLVLVLVRSDASNSGIDQAGIVIAKFHAAVERETGWFGVTMLGGPNPRRAGGISTKT
ncbi:hypothetical protein C8R47DRAFT_1080714 [Mycena vitilis]|nr:hypothetical protein C8R47DRAFT_1080714 [Mycena vitilis]